MNRPRKLSALLAERDAKILALKGRKPFTSIAIELNVSIGVVSGVMFRSNHPRPATPRSRRAAAAPAMSMDLG